jgi:hypothetical protein
MNIKHDMKESHMCTVCKKKTLIPIMCECGFCSCIKHRFHLCEEKLKKDREILKSTVMIETQSSKNLTKI